MKYVYLFLCLILSIPVFAQEETLIGSEIESGGFGGPSLKITQLNNENAVLLGARGGWIINHTFVLGGAGYGLVTRVQAQKTDSIHHTIDFGYGGLDLEYIASSNNLVHLSIGLLVGAGGVGYRNDDDNRYDDIIDDSHPKDAFFILEPNVQANLNVTSFFRIAAGVSYRYISGLQSQLATNTSLDGVSGVLTLKFGKF
jgi:hypothetical protein